jgi:hypothetical protein
LEFRIELVNRLAKERPEPRNTLWMRYIILHAYLLSNQSVLAHHGSRDLEFFGRCMSALAETTLHGLYELMYNAGH